MQKILMAVAILMVLPLSACAAGSEFAVDAACRGDADRPPEAVTVALGTFDPALRGLCLTGHLQGHSLVPYGPVLPTPPQTHVAATPVRVTWRAMDFATLPNWRQDRQGQALAAFAKTCPAILKKPGDTGFGAFGQAGDWRTACLAALAQGQPGDTAARDFFATYFRPWQVAANGDADGLFTGYYEPLLDGARQRSLTYATPLRAMPDDMVTVRPSDFFAGLSTKRLTGRIEGQVLLPYPERRAIAAGALAVGQDRPLVWVRDPVEAFFLQIQGSGIVRLADGQSVRVGYAGQNGRAYSAIGGEIVRRGGLTRDNVSAQTIMQWLRAHPDQAADVMDTNPSYVFFRFLNAPIGDGPTGAAGVALTPQRSLAVDHALLPYGVPVWVDAGGFQRLMVAQDTGGAIRGAVRGDVFWGRGDMAARNAGMMKARGQMWLLLPRGVTPSL